MTTPRNHSSNSSDCPYTALEVNVPSYILDAVRSPFGRLGKGLAGVRPDDLAAEVMASLMARNEAFDTR